MTGLAVDIPAGLAMPAADLHAALVRLFPSRGVYLVKAVATGRIAEVDLSAALPGEVGQNPDRILAAWRAIFPAPGHYWVGPKTALFLKGLAPVIPAEGAQFEEWFLERLVTESRTQFGTVRDLIDRTLEAFIREHGGHLTEPETLAQLERLLFDLRQGIRWSLAHPVSPETEARLRALGFTDRALLDFPGLAYRLGMIDEALRAPGAAFSWPAVLELAARVPLLPADLAAMTFARQRVGAYLTPVLMKTGQAIELAAAQAEVTALRTMTRAAIAAEMHPRDFARELYKTFDAQGIVRDWERVARTEMAEARTRGAWAVARHQWSGGTEVYRQLAAQPCSGCVLLYRQADGMPRVYVAAEVERQDAEGPNRGPWREWHARIGPTHPNCFPGETLVSAQHVRAGMGRHYEGEIAVLTTAAGQHLTCTPNHPILTPTGWLPAGCLNVGTDVIGCRGSDRMRSRDMYDQEMPSRIEEIADAVGRARGVPAIPVPVAAEDFHGDGAGSEIAVVRADRLLGDHHEAALLEQALQVFFLWGATQATRFARASALRPFFQRVRATPDRRMSCLGALAALLWSAARGREALGLAEAPHRNPLFIEPTLDGGSGYSQFLREGIHTCASSIAIRECFLGLRQGQPRGDLRTLDAAPDAHAHRPKAFDYGGTANARGVGDGSRGFPSKISADQLGERDLWGNLHTFKASADGSADVPEPLGERVAPDPRCRRELPDRFASEVSALQLEQGIGGMLVVDQIRKVERRTFSGHVYNLTTESGVYVAGGLVVHNCVCPPWQAWLPALRPVFEPTAEQWRRRYAQLKLEKEAA